MTNTLYKDILVIMVRGCDACTTYRYTQLDFLVGPLHITWLWITWLWDGSDTKFADATVLSSVRVSRG